MPSPRRVIWAVSDGRRGIENQALGLAQALGRLAPSKIIRKVIGSDPGFAKLPPSLQLLRRARPIKYGLAVPYGDIIIGCGRQAIAPLRAIKTAHPDSFVVYLQDPRGSYTHFDLIIAPEHDGLTQSNAISMIGSPNLMTAEKLDSSALAFKKPLQAFPAPRAAVLIGGPSKRHTVNQDIIAAHIAAAQNLLDKGYSLLITLSRRTDDKSQTAWTRLSQAHPDKIWLYGGRKTTAAPNPYMAFLKAADIICVTEESTNMLTEACASGKPVYRLPMAGDAGKFQQLYEALENRCHVRLFDQALTATPYIPLNETDRIAALVTARYKQFRSKPA